MLDSVPAYEGTLPDESDRPFVEVARAAGATLITGNTRHFPSETGIIVKWTQFFGPARRPAKVESSSGLMTIFVVVDCLFYGKRSRSSSASMSSRSSNKKARSRPRSRVSAA